MCIGIDVPSNAISLADLAVHVITWAIIRQLRNVNHGCGSCATLWRRKCTCSKQCSYQWLQQVGAQKIRSVGRIGRFTCEYVACKAIIVFFHRVSSQSSAIPSSVIPSILKTQLSAVEQQNKDRTAHHSVSVRHYSNSRCTIIVTYFPIALEFQKVV